MVKVNFRSGAVEKVKWIDKGGMANLTERTYDASCIGEWQTCPRSFFYTYVLGLKPIEVNLPMYFGSVMHEVFRVWFTTGDLDLALVELNAMPEETGDPNRNRGRGKFIFKEYAERFPFASEDFKVRDVEVEFHLDMPDERVYSGRIDMIGEKDNLIYIMDHKTSKSVGASFFDQFRPNIQITGYCYACRELVGECAGAYVNALSTAQKPQVRASRLAIPRIASELDYFPVQFTLDCSEIERSLEVGNWSRREANCYKWWKLCKYADLCIHGASPEMIRMKFTTPEEREEEKVG